MSESKIITPLNLPKAQLELSQSKSDLWVKCLVRKKKLVCTPEEWVRQHVLNFLILQSYPQGLLGVEVALKYNGRNKRADIVVYGKDQKPVMIVECKAPEIPLTEAVFRQIASYNFVLQVDYLMMTNGLQHIYGKIDRETGQIEYLEQLPRLSF